MRKIKRKRKRAAQSAWSVAMSSVRRARMATATIIGLAGSPRRAAPGSR
jgi:hypothetical protein